MAASGPGDTVLVCPGTYVENIDYQGKPIVVRSAAGPAQTVLDGGARTRVVKFVTNEGRGSILEGFTVRNGYARWNATTTDLDGGGIFISNASPVVRGNVISGNRACNGAGIGVIGGAPLIEDNTITENFQDACSGGSGGGGIGVREVSTAIIRRNTISRNINGSIGGGISLYGASATTVVQNVISGNEGSYQGGGIWIANEADATIAGNVIVDNHAEAGGGIYWFGNTVRGVLLAGNTIAENDGVKGSAVYADGISTGRAMVNNILVAKAGQTAVWCGNFIDSTPPAFRSNNVFSPTGSTYGGICTQQTGLNGNISEDPLFVNPAEGDFHLRHASPSIDSGDMSAVAADATDVDGDARVIDGDGDGTARPDMGADETPYPPRLLRLETPAGGTVGGAFAISGWAIDGRGANSGVDAVHVWAFPDNGAAAIFLGVAQHGLARPDVARDLRDAGYLNSGFMLRAPAFGAGTYVIAAYARSSASGTWDSVATARVTLRSVPMMTIDTPADGANGGTNIRMSGWAVDLGHADGPGVDAIHVYAFAPTGGPIFLGSATYGLQRPDVAAAFGSPQFAASGWALDARLPPGRYQIGVYARSAVTGTFNQSRLCAVSVTAAPARIAIDTPAGGTTAAQPLVLAGWALAPDADADGRAGAGIDAVHVYAFPNPGSGAPPIFVGAASHGASRPDVAAAFGTQFLNSGFTLDISGLPPGTYLLAVYARNTISGAFDGVETVLLTLRP